MEGPDDPPPATGRSLHLLGALDKGAIDRTIKRDMASIRRCYEEGLAGRADLAGKVTIRFVVAADGAVQAAEVKTSTLGDAGVEGCIVGVFRALRFPEPRGGGIVIVSYPFIFSPG